MIWNPISHRLPPLYLWSEQGSCVLLVPGVAMCSQGVRVRVRVTSFVSLDMLIDHTSMLARMKLE